jgi:hypothetical protein
MTALLWRLPEPATPKERKAQREIHELLDRAAEQQAESSPSRRRGPDANQRASTGRDARDASVHQGLHDAGAANLPRYMSMSAPSVTLGSSWTPVDVEGWMGDRRPTIGTTHVVVGITTPTRTGARALHRQGLRLSLSTSSAHHSRSDTARRPTSSNTLGIGPRPMAQGLLACLPGRRCGR